MPVLTRNASLSGLNALPAHVNSVEELAKTIEVLEGFLSQLELPTSGMRPFSQTDLGTNITKTLKEFVPKVQAAVEANIVQSKALAKVLGAVAACLSFVASDEYAEIIVEKVLASEGLGDLIAQKVQDKVAELGGGTRGGRSSVVPETPMRAQRKMGLENPLHWAVHRQVHKAYKRGPKVVISPLTEWPDAEDVGYLEEVVDGKTVRRWRPDWEASSAKTPFESAVVHVLRDEGTDATADEVKAGLRNYMVSIVRQRREAASGLAEAKKAENNMKKRQDWLVSTMLTSFENSVLNECDERDFYRAMFSSKAFSFVNCNVNEPHGLPKPNDVMSDGSLTAYDGFELYSDLWFRDSQDPGQVAMIREVDWWSPKSRLAFWILYEELKRETGKMARLPIFHLPAEKRPPSTLRNLPRLTVPAGLSDSPTTSKRQKIETFALTAGMVHDGIHHNRVADFSTWTCLLADDPPKDDDFPPLSELLKREDKIDLARRAHAHMQLPPSMSLDHLRKLWRIKQQGTPAMYAAVLRGENPGEQASAVTEEAMTEAMYNDDS